MAALRRPMLRLLPKQVANQVASQLLLYQKLRVTVQRLF